MFEPFVRRWRERIPTISVVAAQLHHWVYYSAYGVLAQTVRTRAATTGGLSEEVSRARVLLTQFLFHLENYPHKHINPSAGSILDKDIIGTREDFRKWRDAYKPVDLYRSARTYPKRLQIWEQIYAGKYVDEDGNAITYEEVIADRMDEIVNSNVPYWMFWNYGSDYKTGRPGSPAYSGIHFLERGEASIPKFSRDAARFLRLYAVRALLSRAEPSPPAVLNPAWREVYARYGT